MGFHVVTGSNYQFLTAGHCSHGSRSNNWYHKGLSGTGYVGNVKATLYQTHGSDIMRVGMSSSQDSDRYYLTSSSWTSITSVVLPSSGMNVCASLGVSNTQKCGTVTSASVSWTSATCGCLVNGADTSISTIGGDSGAPLRSGSRAVGIMNTSNGRFAKVKPALDFWGYSLR